MTKHVGPSIMRRLERHANTVGYVHWTYLVENGLVRIEWQQSPVTELPQSLEVAGLQNPPTGGVCGNATRRAADLESNLTVTGAAVVELWGSGGFSQPTLVPAGESWPFTAGYGGAVWEFQNCSTEQTMAAEASQGKNPKLVSDLPGGIAAKN